MITLINSTCAKVGYEFVNYGVAEECNGCKLKKICLENLEPGRKYRVTACRSFEHNCRVHGKVRVVEIKDAEVTGVIDKKIAYAGSTIEFEPVGCRSVFCKYFINCHPEGLKKGDKCKISEVLGALDCESKQNLVRVKLKRLEH